MSDYKQQPLDLSGLRTYPLASRPSKVSLSDFGKPPSPGMTLRDWLDTLPRVLGADALRGIAREIREARMRSRPVLVGFGGHVIKVGLAPILIDLMERGYITGFATTGSGVIHDFEIAWAGSTSEDVDAALPEGRFGMAEETGRLINEALVQAAKADRGAGEGIAAFLSQARPPHAPMSLLCQSYERRIPLTVHLTIGADITNIHPTADGAALGETSLRDFKLFCSMVGELNGGGVYLNLGSAVSLPEVFLKAVTVVRNLGNPLEDFSTANFDIIQHYRPATNVLRRPVEGVGRNYALTGHHEVIIPLLAAAIIEAKA